MKKIKTICILFLAIVTSTAFLYSEEIHQQEEKTLSPHEVYLGFGYPNSLTPIFVGGIQDIFTAIFSGGKQGTELKCYGVTQLGYNWYCIPGKGLSVGGLFTAEPYKTIHKYKDTPEKNYEETTTMFTIQATVRYQYGWEKLRLYHGISLGLGLVTTYDSNNATTPIFAFNIIPIGLKLGNEQGINVFADVGIGTTPLINIGANYRF